MKEMTGQCTKEPVKPRTQQLEGDGYRQNQINI